MKRSLPFLFHPQSQIRRMSGGLRLQLYLSQSIEVEQIEVFLEPNNEARLLAMTADPSPTRKAVWQAWHCHVPIAPHRDATRYCFKVVIKGTQYWCHGGGISRRIPLRQLFFKVNRSAPPAWVQEQVFYQIFVDRFHASTLNPAFRDNRAAPHHPMVKKPWGAPIAPSHAEGAASEFYGGDLRGVIEKLDYLSELGVTALYLNPIFNSPSNHKYDTTDYKLVDPQYGGNEALIQLRQDLSRRGMRLILDAVINHTSEQHPWFDRFGGQGAHGNPDSPYRNFYSFDKQGHAWCWMGCETLPKLNYAEPQVQQLIYKGAQSVIQYWLAPPFAIDGWRFDVLPMIGETTSAYRNHHYVTELRHAIKQVNPKAYMLGEHTHEATAWLQGAEEDGAMNYYGFTSPVQAFLLGHDPAKGQTTTIDAQELNHWFNESRGVIPFANQLAQFNQIDSHDTPRFITLANGNLALTRLAVTLLLTYPGAPCIYYGDEVGLEGAHDPDNRRCFNWDPSTWQQPLLRHYRDLIALRRSSPELTHGDLIPLYAKGDVYAFARWFKGRHTLVVINRGGACQVKLDLLCVGSQDLSYMDSLSQRHFHSAAQQLKLDIGERSALVLQPI
jgi:alpha-glucosidase